MKKMVILTATDNLAGILVLGQLDYMTPRPLPAVYSQVADVIDYLSHPTAGMDTAMVLIPDTAQLNKLAVRSELLDQTQVILVLPDDSPEIVALGHTLRPRFVTFADSDLGPVGQVMARLVNVTHTQDS